MANSKQPQQYKRAGRVAHRLAREKGWKGTKHTKEGPVDYLIRWAYTLGLEDREEE